MQKLSKSEFMHKVINDKYNKRLKEKEMLNGAMIHSIENNIKIQDYKRRKKDYGY
ncbi:MAG: hypothetical protein ACRC7N_21330 [Clostridium sp.]